METSPPSPDPPHEWPEQLCGKCKRPVGGETIHRQGVFYHPACLGGVIPPPYVSDIDDADIPF